MIDHHENHELLMKYAHCFGRIAIEMGFVSPDQVKYALDEQTIYYSYSAFRHHKLIGEILFENGWITLYQIERVLEKIANLK